MDETDRNAVRAPIHAATTRQTSKNVECPLFCSDGNDAIDVSAVSSSNAAINAGAGNDTVEGGSGHDLLVGREGDDILSGRDGDDVIYGNEGDDTLFGGIGGGSSGSEPQQAQSGDDGDDLINGGPGEDLVDGGTGVNVEDSGEVDFTFIPGRISYAPDVMINPVGQPNNPILIQHPYVASSIGHPLNPDNNRIGAITFAAWDVSLPTFVVNGAQVLDEIAIVQITKTTGVQSGWGENEALREDVWNDKKDWHIDYGFPVPNDFAAPNPIGGSTSFRFDQLPPGGPRLSMQDAPFNLGYVGIEETGLDGVSRMHQVKVEFETYVIGFRGDEGLKYDLDYTFWGVTSSLTNVTVYGGFKWHYEYDFSPPLPPADYVGDAVKTDTIGMPSVEFGYALRKHLDREIVWGNVYM